MMKHRNHSIIINIDRGSGSQVSGCNRGADGRDRWRCRGRLEGGESATLELTISNLSDVDASYQKLVLLTCRVGRLR